MTVSCPISIVTPQNVWEILAFLSVPLFTYAISGHMFSSFKYEVFRHASRSMALWVRTCILIVMDFSIAWAAWRVWSCGGWDAQLWPLAVWFFYVVFANLESLVLSASLPYLIVALLWQLAALGFNIAMVILFWSRDSYAAIVAVIHMAFWGYEIIYSTLILAFYDRRTAFEAGFAQKVEDLKHTRIATAGAAAEKTSEQASSALNLGDGGEGSDTESTATRQDLSQTQSASTQTTKPATPPNPELSHISSQFDQANLYPNSNLTRRNVGLSIQIPT